MKLLKYKKSVSTYMQSKPFGHYYLPARFQYLILRDYFKKKNFIFSLPQGEPVFTKTYIRFRDVVSKLEKRSDLVLLSIFMLPKEIAIRKKIVKQLLLKKITTHFIFENKIAKKNSEYSEILDLLKLNKFTKN